jgi:hypothetical protein
MGGVVKHSGGPARLFAPIDNFASPEFGAVREPCAGTVKLTLIMIYFAKANTT